MSKRKGRRAKAIAKKPDQAMHAFTFGEPSAVLDRRDILDYAECISNGKWLEPPVSFAGLAKSLRAAARRYM